MPEASTIQGVGHSVRRKEDPRFLRGKGNYIDDIKLPGMLYMDIVRSPYAHARIVKIDASEALKVPGVAATKGHCLIDSGSADAVDHPLIKQSSGHVEKTTTGVGLGTPITGYIGRAEYFKLGPHVVRKPVLACCGGNEFNQQMIGAGILDHFDVIFDFPHSRLYVRRR